MSDRCIPSTPERDGYHWVRRYRGGPAIPLAWFANWHQNVGRGWGEWSEPNREDQWEYLGPCPSPDDALSPPEPTEGQRAELVKRVETAPRRVTLDPLGVAADRLDEYRIVVTQVERDMLAAFLRAMPLQDHASKASDTFELPISDCGQFIAGELGPDVWTNENAETHPKFGVIVWYESQEVMMKACGAACDAHWSEPNSMVAEERTDG